MLGSVRRRRRFLPKRAHQRVVYVKKINSSRCLLEHFFRMFEHSNLWLENIALSRRLRTFSRLTVCSRASSTLTTTTAQCLSRWFAAFDTFDDDGQTHFFSVEIWKKFMLNNKKTSSTFFWYFMMMILIFFPSVGRSKEISDSLDSMNSFDFVKIDSLADKWMNFNPMWSEW